MWLIIKTEMSGNTGILKTFNVREFRYLFSNSRQRPLHLEPVEGAPPISVLQVFTNIVAVATCRIQIQLYDSISFASFIIIKMFVFWSVSIFWNVFDSAIHFYWLTMIQNNITKFFNALWNVSVARI